MSELQAGAKHVGLMVIATNRYIQFVGPLVESARPWFMRGQKVTFFVFTDAAEGPPGTVAIPHEHQKWPMPTLLRYRAFVRAKEMLGACDYLYYCDADMRFVAEVGEEALGDLVAVRHPGYFAKARAEFPYEDRAESAACVAAGEGMCYYAGGFQGGRASTYLGVAAELAARIDKDLARGVVARWHDESHWNRYLVDHPPAVALSPSYCYPESWDLPFEKKLLALDKDHDAVRGVKRGMGERMVRLMKRLVRGQ